MSKVGVLVLVVQLTMFGGAKHGGTNDVTNVDGTNVVTEVMGTNDVGDAWVVFEGDGPLNLADPSFAAKAGETNRVVILIGKTYIVCQVKYIIQF